MLFSAASSRDRAPAFVSRDYLRENLLERLNANARRLVVTSCLNLRRRYVSVSVMFST